MTLTILINSATNAITPELAWVLTAVLNYSVPISNFSNFPNLPTSLSLSAGKKKKDHYE